MNPTRHPDPDSGRDAREHLSSFVDGECPPSAAEDACRRWRTDDDLRSTWRTYHVIGEVLRSDELSVSSRGDEAFLLALRERLAVEPVPLAPAPLVAPGAPSPAPGRDRAWRWMAPAAAVAGFVAVGVTVVALRPEAAPVGFDERLVASPPVDNGVMRRVGSAPAPASGPMLVVDGQLIRDARLDAYFEAHRGAVGAGPSAVPGGALRSVEILVPQR